MTGDGARGRCILLRLGAGWRCLAPGLVALAALLSLTGCAAPLSAERFGPKESYAQLNRSALSGNWLSDATLLVLRRHGLLEAWDRYPDETIASLHGQVVTRRQAWPELFALAEMSYLRQRLTGSQPDAFAAAIYAYAFLFPSGTADQPSPYDRRFRQACDIYNLSLSAAFTPPDKRAARLSAGHYALPFGTLDLGIDQAQLRWAGRPLVSFAPTSDLAVNGLQNIFRSPGLGAPLAAMPEEAGGAALQSRGLEVAPRLRVPANALMVMDNARRQLATGATLRASLVVHTIFNDRDVRIGDQVVPLEYNQTTARALSLVEASVWADERRGFLNGMLFDRAPTRLIALEPHRSGRMPVILVHGTASSPFRWADMVNDLLEDPQIRDNFEFWFFSYPSGGPIPYSALRLRRAIDTAVQQLGGTRADPALGRMTVIGHSQGGLLAKMLVIDPGDRLWNGISQRPLDSLRLSPQSHALLRDSLFPHSLSEVQRVIFIATPHRGSYIAAFSIVRLISRLVTLPLDVAALGQEILTGNADALEVVPSRLKLGSIYGMTPGNPFIKALAAVPIAPGVHAHSIIAVRTSGPLSEASDGVVRYTSAHLDGVDSELVVRSGHSAQSNPATIAEVRRILLLQLAASRAPVPGPAPPLASLAAPTSH